MKAFEKLFLSGVLSVMLPLLFLIIGCQMKTKENVDVSSQSIQKETSSTNNLIKIGKVVDTFKFQSVETGWSESTKRAGKMYVNVRLIIKNISDEAISDISVFQNQLTYKFLDDNNIVIDEHFQTIQSSVMPAWDAGQSKYVTLISTPSFNNFTEKYKTKIIYVEIFYHDILVWKGKIQNVIVDWN